MREVGQVRSLDNQILWLKRWIWVYFWLLLLEGVLRKWVLPALSGPLLIVRDPVAVIIYIQAYRCGKFSLKVMWPVAIISLAILPLTVAQLILGVNSPAIALYGLRSYLLHLPLVVVMAETLTAKDIHKLGRWLLILSVPMTALLVAQFYAPSISWINVGAGEGAGQIGSAAGHIRPAGTFSYGIGAQCFVMFVAAFILHALTRRGMYPRWLIWSAAMATIAAIPVLASRTVLFTMAVLIIFCLIAGASSTARFFGFVKVLVLLLLFSALIYQLPFFQDASSVMSARWEQASSSEGDVQEVLNKRIVGSIESAFETAATAPWLGKGIGMGSNFASVLITGRASFLLAEGEWERVVLEFGPVFGLAFMGMRVFLAIYLILRAMHSLRRKDILAWVLVPAVVPLLLMTIMEQPTFQGFMIFGVGLCLTAARVTRPLVIRPPHLHWSNRPNRVTDGRSSSFA
jgi:hypothetical protein